MTKEEEEPLSPMARVFESPEVDYCVVIKIGFKTKIKPEVVLNALKHNVYKHPRFSSKLNSWFFTSILNIGSTMRHIWNTIVDLLLLVAIIFFLKDTKTPLKGGADTRSNPKRFDHRIIALEDVILIKNVMNMTKNDNDEAMISCPNNLPNGIRFHSGCTINLRSDIGLKPLADMMVKDSKCRWGNFPSPSVCKRSIGLSKDI